MPVELTSIPTLVGPLWIAESERGLCHVGFTDPAPTMPDNWHFIAGKDSAACRQLREYFAGERTRFDLPLNVRGTAFQQQVWAALQDIGYGERTSYGALAKTLGRSGAARAVGSANAKNSIAIVIPCHRVVAADGGISGFAWGPETKRALLDFEARVHSAQSVARRAGH